MKRFMLCSALVLSLIGIARADDANLQHLVVGIGMKNCSFYVNNNDAVVKLLVYSWVQGAVTGVDKAMVAATGKEVLINKVQTSDVVTSTFDNICRSKPDITIDAATDETVGALMQQ